MCALRVGVDVGGTNTDAVLVDTAGTIMSRIKVATTPEPADGVIEALTHVSRGRDIEQVAFGTTHALNAILRREGLQRVALVRLGSPGTEAISPLAGWPEDLTAAVSAGTWIARGGVEIDGRHVALDHEELSGIAATIAREGVAGAIAIVGMFSPLDPEQERSACTLFAGTTGLPVSLSSEIGGLGLLERENATVLNAALGGLVLNLITSLTEAITRLGDGVRGFLTQNDGTLMALAHARHAPVFMIGAGASNSVRGAALLTGRSDALVIDVGGTSADVGALVNGFPRESAAGVEIGGVNTNFHMPDLVSVQVGGGSVIEVDGSIGANSVGALLLDAALVFGGSTPTLTDAAVVTGRASIGDASLVPHVDMFTGALAEADDRIAGAIDRMRSGHGDVDLVAVGGGAILLPDRIPGIAHIERPAEADVANAVGAALAPVGGEADFVADMSGDRREAQLARATREAGERAIAAGARADALETIWIEEIPLAYVEGPVSRIRAKVAGPPADVVP